MNLTDPIFHDLDKAREWLEAQRWPDGPICPHCGNSDPDKIGGLEGEAHRKGLYKCYECREQFTVQVGSVMERSHIPLTKWALAMFLMASSKKSMSARQVARMMEIPVKTAWFLCHRIREAMKPATRGPLGGEGKIVEADETYIGGKETNKHISKRKKGNLGGKGKMVVFALVERDGLSHSFRVASVTGEMLRPLIVTHVNRKSALMTDMGGQYFHVGKEFARHETVNHGADEYVRGDAHTNTMECRFSLMKRAVYGTHHSISEAHLHRYLVEWDFKFNTRKVSDTARTALIVKQAEGRRLMYQRPKQAANA